MTTIPEIADAMRQVLTTSAHDLERSSGFVQRQSKFNGPLLAQTLVFGFWQQPHATLDDLADVADELGCEITGSAIEQRLGEGAACLLQQLLSIAAAVAVTADPVAIPLLQRFNSVEVIDSTQILLPVELAALWPGCGNGSGPQASLKVLLRQDMRTGGLRPPQLVAGQTHDAAAARELAPLAPGSLHLGDLGFFDLAQFAAWDEQGVYFVSRYKVGTAVLINGQRIDLPAWLAAQEQLHAASATSGTVQFETAIQLGMGQQLGCRLVVEVVPPAVALERQRRIIAEAAEAGRAVSTAKLALARYSLVLTNVAAQLLSMREVLVLLEVRWQIELLFKRWKSLVQIDEWRSKKPWRVLCEVYAKLLVALLQHWLLVVSCWAQVDRSLWKATRQLQAYGTRLASAWQDGARLVRLLGRIARRLARAARINKQPSRPATYERLLAASSHRAEAA